MKAAGIGGALPDGIMRHAEVEVVLDDARYGVLLQSDEAFRPVVVNPHLWELKFKFGGRQFRLYFGEPPMAPGFLVALHFHHKIIIEGNNDETNRLQDEQIRIAIQRYDECEANNWSILG